MGKLDFGEVKMHDRFFKYCHRQKSSLLPYIKKIEWIANLFIIPAGFILAVSPESAKNGWWIFVMLTIGQICWMVSGFVTSKITMITMSSFFAIINIYAIIVRLI